MSRGRRARTPELGEKVAEAKVRYYGVGPRKVRLVADLIRGLTVPEAEQQLLVLHKPSAVPLVKRLLKSAVSNANNAHREGNGPEYKVDQLIVGAITVDSGPIAKRYHARAMGRGAPIRKRSSHITVQLYSQPAAQG
jgi:large subunit ribosomal protein L22